MGFAGGRLIIGHRGAAGLAPENTLASFRMAADLGVDGVELDVHRIEGRLVVIHDEVLERTTSGTGRLGDCRLAALRRLDAGGGQSIPLLEEVFAVLPPTVGVNIELKGKDTAELASALALKEQADQGRDILISSFDLAELRHTADLTEGRIKIAPLFSRWPKQGWPLVQSLGAWSVNLGARAASRLRLDEARARGIRVLVYTVNEPKTAERLFNWGAVGLFTVRPDRMLGVNLPPIR